MAQTYRPRPISGFPEWLPEIRRVEQQWMDHIRSVFESYGFCNIETPSVEELDVLLAKGEVDKEIYVLERLHKEEGDKDARLALHFDQTVPLARYVAQHFNDLVFPFKRYQMQRVWRGERPQAGRSREFYQCDIDVIGVDNLDLSFDAEMPAIMWEILTKLPGMENEPVQIRVSNRKLLLGIFEILDITQDEDKASILRVIDKKEKLGYEFESVLKEELSKYQKQQKNGYDVAQSIFNFLNWADTLAETAKESLISDQIIAIKHHLIGQDFMSNQMYKEGVDELLFVLEQLSHLPPGAVAADLSIVRGLDYYTGTVYETKLLNNPDWGSICSGGRYDDLAGSYINKHLPGVGISIGLTRLFSYILDQGKLPATRHSPADVLVTLFDEEDRSEAIKTAQILRQRGIKVELYHAASKPKKQLSYAEKKGIPYVWFLPSDQTDSKHAVKNMTQNQQEESDPNTWIPV